MVEAMRKLLPAVLGAVLVVSVAACSSSSKSASNNTSTSSAPTSPSSTGAPTTTISNAALQSQLLTLAEMPAGWSVDNTSTSGVSIKGCDTQVFESQPNKAKAAFQGGASGYPATQETIVGYPADQAKADYTRVLNHFNACKSFTITYQGKGYSGTVGAMSLGQSYGDQSAAWQFSLDVSGLTLGVDSVLVLKGNENMGFSYEDLGTPDLATVQGLVAKATAKLP
jgi:hypothetical protein